MTKDEALAALREQLTTLQSWCCIHQDEYGTHYAPECQDDIDQLEEIIDTVRGLHTTEFVAEWLSEDPGLYGPGRKAHVIERWREEME